MVLPSPRLILTCLVTAAAGGWFLSAQDPAPAISPGDPLVLDLSRRDLVNFLTDEKALAPYRRKNGENAALRDVFMLGSVKAPWAVIWDPHACRLLGIVDLVAAEKAPDPAQPAPADPADEENASGNTASPFLFKAEGPIPLAKTQGASDTPRYFGFRLVDGAPEFLYLCGRLSIEERLWLDEDGEVLRQRLVVKDPPKNIVFTVPSAWKGRVEASAGSWKGSELTVPKEQAGGLVLSYRLSGNEGEPQPAESN